MASCALRNAQVISTLLKKFHKQGFGTERPLSIAIGSPPDKLPLAIVPIVIGTIAIQKGSKEGK
jgi:hypothetical protein